MVIGYRHKNYWAFGYKSQGLLGKRVMACLNKSHGFLDTRIMGFWVQDSWVTGYKICGLLDAGVTGFFKLLFALL